MAIEKTLTQEAPKTPKDRAIELLKLQRRAENVRVFADTINKLDGRLRGQLSKNAFTGSGLTYKDIQDVMAPQMKMWMMATDVNIVVDVANFYGVPRGVISQWNFLAMVDRLSEFCPSRVDMVKDACDNVKNMVRYFGGADAEGYDVELAAERAYDILYHNRKWYAQAAIVARELIKGKDYHFYNAAKMAITDTLYEDPDASKKLSAELKVPDLKFHKFAEELLIQELQTLSFYFEPFKSKQRKTLNICRVALLDAEDVFTRAFKLNVFNIRFGRANECARLADMSLNRKRQLAAEVITENPSSHKPNGVLAIASHFGLEMILDDMETVKGLVGPQRLENFPDAD